MKRQRRGRSGCMMHLAFRWTGRWRPHVSQQCAHCGALLMERGHHYDSPHGELWLCDDCHAATQKRM